MENSINIIDNLIEAISILNKTDEYLENLGDRLSECDQLKSDFEHIIENSNLQDVNLQFLFNEFQKDLLDRRKIKNDIALNTYLKKNSNKLQEKANRAFLIQGLKNVEKQTSDSTDYKNRIIPEDMLQKIKTIETVNRKRGRPKKEAK